jgi:hypothetical protein
MAHFFSELLAKHPDSKVFLRSELAEESKRKWKTQPPQNVEDMEPMIHGLHLLKEDKRVRQKDYMGLALTAIFYPLPGNTRRIEIAETWQKKGIVPSNFIGHMNKDPRKNRRPPFAVLPLELAQVVDSKCLVCSKEYDSTSSLALNTDPVALLGCSGEFHCFHRKCITTWMESVKIRKCPHCHEEILLVY